MKNSLKTLCFSSFLIVCFSFYSQPTKAANPYKIVWQKCAPGSDTTYVIRCRLTGGEECFANWQGHCNGDAELEPGA